MRARARVAWIVLAGLVPWLVVAVDYPGSSMMLVFAAGFVTPDPLHVTTLPTYLAVLSRGLPRSLVGWPVATLLWFLALASGVSGLTIGREDPRVTGGLLVLAGLSLLPVAHSVGRPTGVLVVPIGTVALWVVAWWKYGHALRRIAIDNAPSER